MLLAEHNSKLFNTRTSFLLVFFLAKNNRNCTTTFLSTLINCAVWQCLLQRRGRRRKKTKLQFIRNTNSQKKKKLNKPIYTGKTKMNKKNACFKDNVIHLLLILIIDLNAFYVKWSVVDEYFISHNGYG